MKVKLIILSLVFSILLSMSAVFAETTEVVFGPSAAEHKPFQAANPDTVTPTVFAQKFSFTDKEMTTLTLPNIPTWGPRKDGEVEDNSAKISVYKWNTDYETTIAGTALKVYQITNHADGQNEVITFDKPLAAGTYLWVCSDVEVGVGGFGFWGGTVTDTKGAVGFQDGTEMVDVFRMSITLQDPTNPSTGNAGVIILVMFSAMALIILKKRVMA